MDNEILNSLLKRIADNVDRVEERVTDIAITQGKHSVYLDRHSKILEADIPEIKEDLRQHKEGVIQNRARVEILESLAKDHREIIEDVAEFRKEIGPVLEHVDFMRKSKDFIIKDVRKRLLTLAGGATVTIGLTWGREILEWLLKLIP